MRKRCRADSKDALLDVVHTTTDSDVDFVASSDEERKLHGFAIFSSQQRGVEDILRGGLGEAGCPRRFVAAERPRTLYRMYLAYARFSGSKTGSWTTFYKAFRLAFYDVAFLGFRKTDGEHAKCTACEGCQHLRPNASKDESGRFVSDQY